MVTTHRISVDLYIEDFELIAVHSDLQDYSLAYHLNKAIGLKLNRRQKDLLLQDSLWFSVFEWMDEIKDDYWLLISNHCKTETSNLNIGLFEMETSMISKHLIEERKEIDYFLKVETERHGLLNKMINKIKDISGVLTAYEVDVDTLKSKKNLIF